MMAWIVGPREGRFDANGQLQPLQSHNLVLAATGTLLLVVGWFGKLSSGNQDWQHSSLCSMQGSTVVLCWLLLVEVQPWQATSSMDEPC